MLGDTHAGGGDAPCADCPHSQCVLWGGKDTGQPVPRRGALNFLRFGFFFNAFFYNKAALCSAGCLGPLGGAGGALHQGAWVLCRLGWG